MVGGSLTHSLTHSHRLEGMKKFIIGHPMGKPLFELEKRHGVLNNPELRENRTLLL